MVERCDLLAVGAHPDDVDLGCGATLACVAARGARVGIVDLTAGELGTRGDVELRRREAEEAGRVLGVTWRACLGLPDGGLGVHVDGQAAAVVGVLRIARPRVVLLPHPGDPHPDHAAAAALIVRGAFLSGLARWGEELGPPSRPRLLLTYPGPRQILEPVLVIDTAAEYARKRAALASHASQFDPAAGPPTHLATGHFLAAVEGRDRACGNLIGSEFGEGFASVGPIDAGEVAWLLGGLR
ncbi:MAG TPA: bacillithiol biosynthesis deacetylase BshB1 [Thermoanaerobaculaceae bacterium]|nr:bacillithiol biosynthesis deacetylase BshB1 [Thermoanaerobaculaceae bacterium]